MRLITWNVNSIRQRLPRLLALLDRHEPDVVCLQETKVADADFPAEPLLAHGYQSLSHGQGGRNGVAIVSRLPLDEVSRGAPGSPVPDDARLLTARVGDLTVSSVYVVNGKEVGDPAYDLKLAWLDALSSWARASTGPGVEAVLAGDFNVTPDDRDVHDPAAWRGRNLASDPERTRLAGLVDAGYVDLGRAASGDTAGPFTFWDYRMGAFHRGWGLRIDLVLATRPVADRLVGVAVDRDERKPTFGEGKPSDHAPVVVDLRDKRRAASGAPPQAFGEPSGQRSSTQGRFPTAPGNEPEPQGNDAEPSASTGAVRTGRGRPRHLSLGERGLGLGLRR